jgi:hypothetical protein
MDARLHAVLQADLRRRSKRTRDLEQDTDVELELTQSPAGQDETH